ncbi:Nup107 [Drosophila busckii]|uniref:Nuclear pore complex protein n=2 Tax=Drosophila busckii TaxID=30019 RepID=A0A0M3QTZ5_DROBS|nr:Nup107 [Drosophila busckii]
MLSNTSATALGLLSRLHHRANTTINANDVSNLSMADSSLMPDNMDDDADRGRSKTDMLFVQFFEVLQSHSNDTNTLDVIQQLLQACRQAVEQLEQEIERGVGGAQGSKQREASIEWLKLEINTWCLLHALYYDRILMQTQPDEEMLDGPSLGASEKEVIQQLYAANAQLREYQLVVDWLEKSYDQDAQTKALYSHDRMMAWENTLFQLENLQGAAFGRGHEICKQLDPDAPVREGKPLHALDMEDNQRLGRAIFAGVRNGQIDKALKLCKHYGQTWRAAILEGWRLYEDPNYEQDVADTEKHEKLPIEGNPRRDVWKRCAWMLADSKKYDEYTRATAGMFCGHLDALKCLLSSSWQDSLWAHLKVQIDIRVESEIRSNCLKRYHPMPDEYWNGKMTLEQIFDELTVAKDVAVRDYAQSQLGVIQQHIILDSCGELLQHMCRWLDAAPKDATPVSPHQLRIMAHIVLFMREIGRMDQQPQQQQQAERIVAAYVEVLIQRGEPQPIAYYAAGLPNKLQVQLYAKYLMQLDQKRPRELALEAALHAGLDVEQITKHAVESIRLGNSPPSALGEPQTGKISATDKRRIQALEYLTHLTEQRGELLWQANAMMRVYLASKKLECVRQVFAMVPSDVPTQLISIYGSLEHLPPREECSLKEYLCYKIYLAGVDRFNDWLRLQQKRPQPPQAQTRKTMSGQDKFTERMNEQHKEQTYRNELARWEQLVAEQSKLTIDALYNVLLFPEKGWLTDPFTAKQPENAAGLNWDHRKLQMEKLRSICLPEMALLLHEVMMKSGDYASCVRLADEIADERRQLYKVYTKHNIAELLSKIAESSLELLNTKVDPWGYAITA